MMRNGRVKTMMEMWRWKMRINFGCIHGLAWFKRLVVTVIDIGMDLVARLSEDRRQDC